jgi:hypothetical protein
MCPGTGLLSHEIERGLVTCGERARGLVTPPGLRVSWCGCRIVPAPPRHVRAAWAAASRWRARVSSLLVQLAARAVQTPARGRRWTPGSR